MFLSVVVVGAGASHAAIDERAKERALTILERIEKVDPAAEGRFLAGLEHRTATATGREKLRMMYWLLYFGTGGQEEALAQVHALAEEARRLNDVTYAALARSHGIYLEFRQAKSEDAMVRLGEEFDRAVERQDWFAEAEIRRLITYVHWSAGRREAAVRTLKEASAIIPEGTPDSDFSQLALLSTLRFIQADLGDLEALIETAGQMIDIGEASDLPVKGDVITRSFAHLFRLRGEYETALRFYQAYDGMLLSQGKAGQRHTALYGLAITTQRMGSFRLSHDYARNALESYPGTPMFTAALQLVQAINLARLGFPERARETLESAAAFFEGGSAGANKAWRVELLHARAEVARAEGRFGQAMDLTDKYVAGQIELMREESADEVKALRAELAAELARERAERALLEREGELAAQRLKAQTISLALLGLLLIVLATALVAQRRNAKALNASRRKAEAANEAKSRFLANISHELRTPLNAIIGFSEFLSAEGGRMAAARIREYGGLINQSGRHLLDIVSDLLNVAQIEAGGVDLSRRICMLADVAQDALRIVASQAGQAGKEISRALPEDLPSLFVDRRRMKQVLINLLSNALKFTGPDARIELSAERTAAGGIAVTVRDNGIGLAPEKIDTVLEPFVQVDDGWTRSHQGVGLGLSIVRSIVEAHGGSLHIDSQLGKGTRVTVILPPDCIAETPPNASGSRRKVGGTAA